MLPWKAYKHQHTVLGMLVGWQEEASWQPTRGSGPRCAARCTSKNQPFHLTYTQSRGMLVGWTRIGFVPTNQVYTHKPSVPSYLHTVPWYVGRLAGRSFVATNQGVCHRTGEEGGCSDPQPHILSTSALERSQQHLRSWGGFPTTPLVLQPPSFSVEPCSMYVIVAVHW